MVQKVVLWCSCIVPIILIIEYHFIQFVSSTGRERTNGHASTLSTQSSTPKYNLQWIIYSQRMLMIVPFQSQHGTKHVETVVPVLERDEWDCPAVERTDGDAKDRQSLEEVDAEMKFLDKVAAAMEPSCGERQGRVIWVLPQEKHHIVVRDISQGWKGRGKVRGRLKMKTSCVTGYIMWWPRMQSRSGPKVFPKNIPYPRSK